MQMNSCLSWVECLLNFVSLDLLIVVYAEFNDKDQKVVQIIFLVNSPRKSVAIQYVMT